MKSSQMKWSLIAACGLVCASMTGVAVAQSSLGGPDDEGGLAFQVKPELVITGEQHDFGTIDDSKPVKTQITFMNKGTGPLTISDVHATCGCTVPQLAKKTYNPGESGVVEVSFNPTNKKGPQHQTVTITSNDPTKPRREFAVHANVVPLVSVEPQVVQFGQTSKGVGGKQIVKITGRLPNFAATTVTTSDPKVIEAKVLSTTPTKAADGSDVFVSEVELNLLPGAPVGMIQHTASIRTTDASRVPNVTIVGEVMGEVNIQPARISLGALAIGAPIATEIKLAHRAGKPFDITKVDEVTTDGVKRLSFEIVPDNAEKTAYTVKITGTAPSAAGGIKGDVIVSTNIPGEEALKLPYYGFARAEQQANPIRVNPVGAPGEAPIGKPAAQPSPVTPVVAPGAPKPTAAAPK